MSHKNSLYFEDVRNVKDVGDVGREGRDVGTWWGMWRGRGGCEGRGRCGGGGLKGRGGREGRGRGVRDVEDVRDVVVRDALRVILAKAPENGWLEYYFVSFLGRFGLFSGAKMLVSGRVPNPKFQSLDISPNKNSSTHRKKLTN